LTQELMKKQEGKEISILRFAAFRALKEMGNSFYDEAADYVKTHGSPEVKTEFSKLEQAWVGYKSGEELY